METVASNVFGENNTIALSPEEVRMVLDMDPKAGPRKNLTTRKKVD